MTMDHDSVSKFIQSIEHTIDAMSAENQQNVAIVLGTLKIASDRLAAARMTKVYPDVITWISDRSKSWPHVLHMVTMLNAHVAENLTPFCVTASNAHAWLNFIIEITSMYSVTHGDAKIKLGAYLCISDTYLRLVNSYRDEDLNPYLLTILVQDFNKSTSVKNGYLSRYTRSPISVTRQYLDECYRNVRIFTLDFNNRDLSLKERIVMKCYRDVEAFIGITRYRMHDSYQSTSDFTQKDWDFCTCVESLSIIVELSTQMQTPVSVRLSRIHHLLIKNTDILPFDLSIKNLWDLIDKSVVTQNDVKTLTQ